MPRVLVIDDQSEVRTAIELALRSLGFEVIAAESGASGLRKFRESHCDLAIVDVFMPGMDGVKLVRALRERAPHLPVIVISGVLLGESERTALDFLPLAPGLPGIVCLQKPFRPVELIRAIEHAVGAPA